MNDVLNDDALEPIAVIGVAGRFPGANDVAAFWQNVSQGVESIVRLNDDELLAAGVDPALLRNPHYVRAGALLSDIDQFDANFFGYTPREAELMDPQHRLFLEMVWAALENAGCIPDGDNGRVGVYAGCGMNTYLLRNIAPNQEVMTTAGDYPLLIGNDKDFLPTRVSYKLNLKGPSYNLNTACSTSLVAVHVACQALLNYACDLAVAGAVSVRVPQGVGYVYQEGMVLAPDGHCRAFDARAAGTVGGSGGGVVVLKRLREAVAAGDPIVGVIKGSAINNDGGEKVGFTAPSVAGQAAVIAEALAVASVSAESLQYVEAHGTGTKLGDPIEVAALTQAFRAHTARRGFCALGSVKTNIGHLDTAAGMAGLLKVLLALQHRQLPPSLHYTRPNPQIDFAGSPFVVNTELRAWPQGSEPRRAGVSAFGIGGTNAHVIVEEAPPQEPSGPSRRWQPLVVSAKTASALTRATQQLAEHLDAHPTLSVADVAYTLATGRRSFAHRRVVVGAQLPELIHALRRPRTGKVVPEARRVVAFVCAGQGAQYVRMGEGVYRQEATYRAVIDACAEQLRPQLGLDLRALLYPAAGREAAAAAQLEETALAQVAVFVTGMAMARQWQAWGVEPQIGWGHSVGEYVAATLAGVFTLEEAVRVVAERGRVMQAAPRGRLLAVHAAAADLSSWLPAAVSIAAFNGPQATVVGGPSEAVTLLETQLRQWGIASQRVRTSHAFHTPMMTEAGEQFGAWLTQIPLRAPHLPYISSQTGTWITAAEATDPQYWVRQLQEPVQGERGLATLLQEPHLLVLEVGPGGTVAGLLRRHPARRDGQAVVTSLRRESEQQDDGTVLMQAVGQVWEQGIAVAWAALYPGERRRRVALPGYPFERQRYWIARPLGGDAAVAVPAPTALRKAADMGEWFWTPSWRRVVGGQSPAAVPLARRYLLVLDADGVGEEVARRLTQAGRDVLRVTLGTQYRWQGEQEVEVRPEASADYAAVLTELSRRAWWPEEMIHCGVVTGSAEVPEAELEARGLWSVLGLVQAWGQQAGERAVRVTVVSDGMMEVIGGERLHPAKALVLGVVRVGPQEVAGVESRSVDVDATATGAERGAQVYAELCRTAMGASVAYRGGYRWVGSVERVPVPAVEGIPARVRARGVYVITGGLGGIGLTLAAYLARTVQARLLLLSRAPLPPTSHWPQLIEDARVSVSSLAHNEGRIPLLLNKEIPSLRNREENIRKNLAIAEIDTYGSLASLLSQLCSSLAYRYLLESNVNTACGVQTTREALSHQVQVLPKFKKLFDTFLRILAEDQIISIEDERVTFLQPPDAVTSPEILEQQLLEQYPQFRGLIRLLVHCGRHYRAAMSGTMEAIHVLYPEGDPDLLKNSRADTVEYSQYRIFETLLHETIRQIIQLREASTGKALRILEVGGGSGIFTRVLLPSLKGKTVEYTFTDIGKSFVLQRQREWENAGFNFLKYQVFDIETDPSVQGLQPQSFDIILGLDVVHATRSIEHTIRNLKSLLAPNGMLMLLESTNAPRWFDMAFGLAEGWWYFDDAPLRTRSPLMHLDQWEETLRSLGFAEVAAFPQDKNLRATTDMGLILAQETERGSHHEANSLDPQSVAYKVAKITELEELGAEVMVQAADVADPEQVRRALEAAEERFGPIHGVIHAAVTEHYRTIQLKTAEEMIDELAAKVNGARVLVQGLAHRPLDFLLLCSSISSLTGGFGQVGYCAANAYLDAFAQARTSTSPYTVTVNWDRWEHVGLARKFEAWHKSRGSDDLGSGITKEEGVEAFARILNSQVGPQVIVSTKNLPALLAEAAAMRIEKTRMRSLAAMPRDEGNPSTLFVAPRTETEKIVAHVWQEVTGIRQIGVFDNFVELGGDSLLAVKVISRLRDFLHVELTVRGLYEGPTVAEMAERIENLRWVVETHPVTVEGSLDEEEGVL